MRDVSVRVQFKVFMRIISKQVGNIFLRGLGPVDKEVAVRCQARFVSGHCFSDAVKNDNSERLYSRRAMPVTAQQLKLEYLASFLRRH
jgi:hypothetical protein